MIEDSYTYPGGIPGNGMGGAPGNPGGGGIPARKGGPGIGGIPIGGMTGGEAAGTGGAAYACGGAPKTAPLDSAAGGAADCSLAPIRALCASNCALSSSSDNGLLSTFGRLA